MSSNILRKGSIIAAKVPSLNDDNHIWSTFQITNYENDNDWLASIISNTCGVFDNNSECYPFFKSNDGIRFTLLEY
jgi:hypothetical protein